MTAFWVQTVWKAASDPHEDQEAGKGPEREECAMPPETLEIPGLCHRGWDAGGLLVGCQGQQHMERPRHAGQTRLGRAGGSCSGWDPGHNPQGEAQHVCRLRRLLGALSPANPSNTFLLQPPIYCRQDQVLEMAGSFMPIPQTLICTQPKTAGWHGRTQCQPEVRPWLRHSFPAPCPRRGPQLPHLQDAGSSPYLLELPTELRIEV